MALKTAVHRTVSCQRRWKQAFVAWHGHEQERQSRALLGLDGARWTTFNGARKSAGASIVRGAAGVV